MLGIDSALDTVARARRLGFGLAGRRGDVARARLGFLAGRDGSTWCKEAAVLGIDSALDTVARARLGFGLAGRRGDAARARLGFLAGREGSTWSDAGRTRARLGRMAVTWQTLYFCSEM